ncbi:hypothetical protein JCM31271_30150 [Halorubrum trueperi]
MFDIIDTTGITWLSPPELDDERSQPVTLMYCIVATLDNCSRPYRSDPGSERVEGFVTGQKRLPMTGTGKRERWSSFDQFPDTRTKGIQIVTIEPERGEKRIGFRSDEITECSHIPGFVKIDHVTRVVSWGVVCDEPADSITVGYGPNWRLKTNKPRENPMKRPLVVP